MTRSIWTPEETDILIKHYAISSKKKLSSLLYSKSWSAICNKAQTLNLLRRPAYKKWTATEIKILRDNYMYTLKEDLLKLIPDRSWESIKLKIETIDID